MFFTAEVAAIDVLHDGAWGGWGFNVASKRGNELTFRNGGFQVSPWSQTRNGLWCCTPEPFSEFQ